MPTAVKMDTLPTTLGRAPFDGLAPRRKNKMAAKWTFLFKVLALRIYLKYVLIALWVLFIVGRVLGLVQPPLYATLYARFLFAIPYYVVYLFVAS